MVDSFTLLKRKLKCEITKNNISAISVGQFIIIVYMSMMILYYHQNVRILNLRQ